MFTLTTRPARKPTLHAFFDRPARPASPLEGLRTVWARPVPRGPINEYFRLDREPGWWAEHSSGGRVTDAAMEARLAEGLVFLRRADADRARIAKNREKHA